VVRVRDVPAVAEAIAIGGVADVAVPVVVLAAVREVTVVATRAAVAGAEDVSNGALSNIKGRNDAALFI
jgi:hypothetical protein